MNAALPLGIMGIVMAFLIASLTAFPGMMGGAPGATTDETYRVEAVAEAGSRFSGAYGSVIEDLVSHQKRPDYQRAEAASQRMTAYGRSLGPGLQGLSVRLGSQLDGLLAQAEAEAAQ